MSNREDDMHEHPERIWIERDDCPYFYEESELAEAGSPVTEYIRADLCHPTPIRCDELKTEKWEAFIAGDWLQISGEHAAWKHSKVRELVTRQNAEEVIAAERAESERLRELLKTQSDAHAKHVKGLIAQHEREGEIYGQAAQDFRQRAEKAEADNATKDAMIDCLADDFQSKCDEISRGWKEFKALEADNAAKDARIKELEKLCNDPVVQARFETVDDGIIGTRSVDVKRVEREDDDSLTVVIDYWPIPSPEAATLKVENKRLREALESIADWPNGGKNYGQENIKRFARTALGEVKP